MLTQLQFGQQTRNTGSSRTARPSSALALWPQFINWVIQPLYGAASETTINAAIKRVNGGSADVTPLLIAAGEIEAHAENSECTSRPSGLTPEQDAARKQEARNAYVEDRVEAGGKPTGGSHRGAAAPRADVVVDEDDVTNLKMSRQRPHPAI